MRAATPGFFALTLVAAAMSMGCATRQYSYALETKDVVSSGKASIAGSGIALTTDNSFSEAAFLGSPVYVNQMHFATAARGLTDHSYEGTLSICVKKPLLWKRSEAPSSQVPQSQAPPPSRGGCGAGVRNVVVDVTSGSSRPTAAAQTTAASSDPNNPSSRRVFELHIPFMDTRLRVAIADDAAAPPAAPHTQAPRILPTQ